MTLQDFLEYAKKNRQNLSPKDFKQLYLRDFLLRWATLSTFPARRCTDLVLEIDNCYTFIGDVQILRHDKYRQYVVNFLEEIVKDSWQELVDLSQKELQMLEEYNRMQEEKRKEKEKAEKEEEGDTEEDETE